MRSASRFLAALTAASLVALSSVWGDTIVPIVESTGDAKVHDAVWDALAIQKQAAVIVALREPPGLDIARFDLQAVRADVAAAQVAALGALPAGEFRLTYQYRAVPALAGQATAEAVDALAEDPNVVEVSVDGVGEAATTQSLPIIRAPQVHAAGLTGEGVIVAVLDSGIDTDHPDLMDDIAYEACFLSQASCPAAPHPAEDDHGHGTNVSGIITSKGTVAPRGVAPDARIAVYKILNQEGSGFFSDWIAGLDDIIDAHPEVDLVNMSLQSGASCPSTALQNAVSLLRARGTTTFIATGNHGVKNAFTVPACLNDAISVGATYDASLGRVDGWKSTCFDQTTAVDQVACWSNSAPALDLLAPGATITSTGRNGARSSFMGTSQAAPHAVGVAALLLEAQPGLTPDDVETRLRATGTFVTDDLHDDNPATNRTRPRIDARVALLEDGDDTDADGCSNGEEYGPDARFGGQRNPLNPYDFYDTNGDGIINVFDDVLAVLTAFGLAGGPDYDPALDRSRPPVGVSPWHLGPPDGSISVDDILAVAAQFGHRCAGPATP